MVGAQFVQEWFGLPLGHAQPDAFGHKPGIVAVVAAFVASARRAVDAGFDVDEAITLVGWLAAHGVDVADISTGGNVAKAPIPVGPGYQVPAATAIKRAAGVVTSTVGMINTPFQAEQVVATGLTGVVMLGREYLRDPAFALHAAEALGVALPPIPRPNHRVYRSRPNSAANASATERKSL